MRIRIARARPDQARQLSVLARRSKRHWGYPEHYIQQWKQELTLTAEFIRRHEVYAANAGERVLGFYALVDRGERMSLEHLWIDPRSMGTGLGRKLFEHATRRAALIGAEAIDIESDPNAAGFYEKMGARRVGRVPAPVAGEERYLPRLTLELTAMVPPKS